MMSFLFIVLPQWVVIPILGTAGKLFAVLCIRLKNRFGYVVNITLSTLMLAFWSYSIIAEEFFNAVIAIMFVLEVALFLLLALGRKYLFIK